jgi:hypothetical protein
LTRLGHGLPILLCCTTGRLVHLVNPATGKVVGATKNRRHRFTANFLDAADEAEQVCLWIRPMLALRSSPYGLIGGALAYPSPAGALFFEAGRRPAPLLHDQPAALIGSDCL